MIQHKNKLTVMHEKRSEIKAALLTGELPPAMGFSTVTKAHDRLLKIRLEKMICKMRTI